MNRNNEDTAISVFFVIICIKLTKGGYMAKRGPKPKAETLGIDFTNKKQFEQLEKYLSLNLTKKEIALIYDIGQSTLERILKDQLDTKFETLQKKYRVELHSRAIRNLINLSDSNDTSATIFLAKITGAVEEKDRQMIDIRREELELKKQEIEIEKKVADNSNKPLTIVIEEA